MIDDFDLLGPTRNIAQLEKHTCMIDDFDLLGRNIAQLEKHTCMCCMNL